jgi:ribosomal protein L4
MQFRGHRGFFYFHLSETYSQLCIEEFNVTDAPAIAKDLHQQLSDQNQVLLNEINKVLENGHLALDKLQNSDIVNTINNITGLMNRLETLGL